MSILCGGCGECKILSAPAANWNAYWSGALVQNAFPDMSPDDRELLISGICGPCYDSLFPPD